MGVFHAKRTHSYAIKRPKGDSWPKHIACFHVKASYSADKHTPHVRNMPNLRWGVLQGWEQWHSERCNPGLGGADWVNGDDAAGFWYETISLAKHVGTLWVFGWNLWPAWCLLDGVREITEGRLILDIRHVAGDNALPGKTPRRSQGLFVAENPPTIICLAVPGGGRIRMIDMANYGITKEAYGVDSDAGALAATVQAVKDYRRLCEVYDLGACQTTAASQAFYCYRRSHMKHDIVCHPIEKVLDLERAAYYGGRCEATRLGRFTEKLYHLDVNSMYTAIGTAVNFPYKYVAAWEPTDKQIAPPDPQGRFIVADVTLETMMPNYPARERVRTDSEGPASRSQGRERIIYPVGRFRTALAGSELYEAVGRGHVVQWHRVQYYDASPIMSHWCLWALEMRRTLSDNGLSHIRGAVKKIMNSLPGKWGQRIKTWEDWGGVSGNGTLSTHEREWYSEWGKHPKTHAITQYRTIAGQTQYMDDEELSATSCPAIAAAWTGYGRTILGGLIDLAGREHVYYYDTDSLIVDGAGYVALANVGYIDKSEPGKLKTLAESDDVEILGIRRYRFGKKWCVAGPFGGEVRGEKLPAEWTEHEGFGGQLWHRSVGDPVMIRRVARWRKEYHHGHVNDDGSISPFRVGGP